MKQTKVVLIALVAIAVLFALTFLRGHDGDHAQRQRDSSSFAGGDPSGWPARLRSLAVSRSTLSRDRLAPGCGSADTLVIPGGQLCELVIAAIDAPVYQYLVLHLANGFRAVVSDAATGSDNTESHSLPTGGDVKLPIAHTGGTITIRCATIGTPCRLVRL